MARDPDSPRQLDTRSELTPRQMEIAYHVFIGATAHEIGAELGIRVETVRAHIKQMAYRLPGKGTARTRIIRHVGRCLAESP